MDYKIQSTITILVLVGIMVGIGLFVNNFNNITGAAATCQCSVDSDCDDNNACTEDICLYADECSAALCINKEIPDCSR